MDSISGPDKRTEMFRNQWERNRRYGYGSDSSVDRRVSIDGYYFENAEPG